MQQRGACLNSDGPIHRQTGEGGGMEGTLGSDFAGTGEGGGNQADSDAGRQIQRLLLGVKAG